MGPARKLVLAVVTVVAVAACGSTSSSGPSTSASASPSSAPVTPSAANASFLASVNADCTTADTASSTLTVPSLSGSLQSPAAGDLATIAAWLPSTVQISQALVTQLTKLGAPPADAAAWSSALASEAQIANDLQAAATAAKAGDLTGYAAAFQKGVTDSNQANSLMTAFGATACEQG